MIGRMIGFTERLFVITTMAFMVTGGEYAYSSGKEKMYAASDIAKELMVKSHAVVRKEEVLFEVINPGKGILTVTKVITILNRKADQYATIYVGYDKSRKVDNIKGRIIDQYGFEVDKLKSSAIEDYSAIQDFSIYEDNRVKHFQLTHTEYPYTVEYSYKLSLDGLLHYPDWTPQGDFNLSVESSVFEVKMPEQVQLRYKEYNLSGNVDRLFNDEDLTFRWEMRNQAALGKEPRMPLLESLVPRVATAPDVFDFEGFEGKMNTWKDIASFQRELNKGRDVLPHATQLKIKQLVAGVENIEEKTRIIYEYLQSNTRYVSVQLGIGGWQPFSAEFVDSHGYGDCKALVNYTRALLKVADVDAYYTLVKAGKNEANIDGDFPSRQFNHVILCVPDRDDTTWLECTSQDSPYGFVGSFTGDRDVLIITENDGKIIHTPAYGADDNMLVQSGAVQIMETGSAEVHLLIGFQGLQYESVMGLADLGEAQQLKALYRMVDIPSFEISKFSLVERKEPVPFAELKLSVDIRKFGSLSGERIFFQPNLLNKVSALTLPTKERQHPIEVDYSYTDIDTMVYKLPAGYHPEFVPEPVSMQTEFGEYHAECRTGEREIIYIRRLLVNKGLYKPELYRDYVSFINEIAKADMIKLVIVKKT